VTAKHGGAVEWTSRPVERSRPATERSSATSGREDDEGGIVLVDASNVAHSTEGEHPQLANILAVRRKLADEGKEPILVADAALRHQIDQRGEYEKLVDQGIVRQAPAGTDADYFLLSFARELDARIVSNDRFRDRAQQFPDALDRLVRYMIVENEVVFEWRARRRDD
jgi:hypothetical protein